MMFLYHHAGQKNYVLFMVLLVGFITAEISYIVCSSQCKFKLDVTWTILSTTFNYDLRNTVIHLDS